jgi:hypothetical protein
MTFFAQSPGGGNRLFELETAAQGAAGIGGDTVASATEQFP